MVDICREITHNRGDERVGKKQRVSDTNWHESEAVRKEYDRLLGILDVEIPPPPCEVHRCSNKVRCKNELVACRSFLEFLNTGYNLGSPTYPTRQIYRKGFYESPYNGSNSIAPDNLSVEKFGVSAKDVSHLYYDITSEEAEIQGKQFANLLAPLEQMGVKNPLVYLAKQNNWDIGFVYKGISRHHRIEFNKGNTKAIKKIRELIKLRRHVSSELYLRGYMYSKTPPHNRKIKIEPDQVFKHDYKKYFIEYLQDELAKARSEKLKNKIRYRKIYKKLSMYYRSGVKLLRTEERRKRTDTCR